MSSKTAPEDRRARPWSLASRLTAWYAASASALVVAATGLLYLALASGLGREDDEELSDKVRVLRAALREPGGGLAAARRQAEWGWAARQYSRVYTRLIDGRGAVALETPGMGEFLPASLFPGPVRADADPASGRDVRTPDGRAFRTQAARASDEAGEPYVIQAALDRTPEEELLASYRGNLWLILGLALAASALMGHRIARRGIRPVRAIAATARRIRPTNLGERLHTGGLPAELSDLADTFNAMLGRLEDSFGRLARFSADIAHELRTPVHNLRGEAEVALSRPRTPAEYQDSLGSCLEECGRLERLIDSLLFLARAENPRTQVEREPVDVGWELAAVREFYGESAAEAGVDLAVEAPPGLVAELNRPLLQRAVGNLVANALAHTPPGGRVTLSAARDGRSVRVEVADTGRGVAPEHLPHLFDRFYRADPARGPGTGGVGLGLAIVRGIAELHGGSASISSEPGRGTRVTLVFPDPAPGPDDEIVIRLS